jgi:predicted DNA-binding transcriptional regulator YafY
LSTIQQGVAERKVLEMEYFSNYKEEVSRRQVEPVGVCYIGNHWHMVAWCRLRGAIRDFRIDRIKSMHLLPEAFKKREQDFLRQYVDRMVRPRSLQKMVVLFDKSVVRYLSEQKFYYGLVDEQPDGEGVRMTFLSGCLEYFGRWLLTWGTKAEVVEPEELKTHLRQLSEDLFLHYRKEVVENVKF